MNLYEKYGGFATIHSIVQNFYDDVLEDELLSPYFKGISMENLIRHQTDFLSQLLGGPISYDGRTLKKAHAHLNITQKSFNRVAVLLQENLEDAGVEEADVTTIMTVVASTVDDIVQSS